MLVFSQRRHSGETFSNDSVLNFIYHFDGINYPDIAQIRLDFTNMAMGNPNAASGVCDGESLVIAAGATNLVGSQVTPTLCGVNTGQHGNS